MFVFLFVALLLATAGITDPVRTAVMKFAGDGAKNCAGPPGSIAEPCLVRAFQTGTPAFWVSHTSSSVSPAALSIGVDKSGGVLFVTRERAGDLITEHRCTQPAIVVQFGRERLRCKETWPQPYRSEIVPFRVAGRVRPPVATTPLIVDSSLCAVAPGKNLSVEFVIDEDGTVRMVDVLGAPEPCDVPAVAASLKKIVFKPGTLEGKAVPTSWFTIIFGK